MWIKILWIIGAAWVCQGVLVYFQIINFQKKIAELKRHGRLGVGTVKGRFGRGVIVIIAVNDEDIITDAQIMTGITVFARFMPFKVLQSQNLKDIATITKSVSKKTKTAVLKAIESLEPSKYNEGEGGT
ncbi:MAG: transcriptional regulator [Thermoanaerobacteraceae bacterium]|jgi:glucitol operon activator protein|nr:transcriptional regulator [Thermoanaerobacteraceae bacterium]